MDLRDVFPVYLLTGNELPYYERVFGREDGIIMKLCFYGVDLLGVRE